MKVKCIGSLFTGILLLFLCTFVVLTNFCIIDFTSHPERTEKITEVEMECTISDNELCVEDGFIYLSEGRPHILNHNVQDMKCVPIDCLLKTNTTQIQITNQSDGEIVCNFYRTEGTKDTYIMGFVLQPEMSERIPNLSATMYYKLTINSSFKGELKVKITD